MATNQSDDEDKMTATVMQILVEQHLRKAGYELTFLFLVLSALVNPAVFCEVEYVVAFQKIKTRMLDGTINIQQAVDDLLTGINLNIVPVDQLLLADFYTFNIQRQPYLIRIRRISWDEARKQNAGKYFDQSGKDLFDYVKAGETRVVMAGNESQTLYDIKWTEADANYVQEMTCYYRDEDLQVKWVGGVFMGNEKDVYNTNPFEHRRLSLVNKQWVTIPVYPFAKSGFEPIDPAMRFAYYKSGAFKEYWDDRSLNKAHQLLHDGTYLEVIKPVFITGIGKIDSSVMAPGATVPLPKDATVTSYTLGPNIAAAYQLLNQQDADMQDSTIAKILEGALGAGRVPAAVVMATINNAKIMLGVFGLMIADLTEQIGRLVADDIIMHTTVGEVDATAPEDLRMQYKTIVARGKERGKDITNKIIFTDELMGRTFTDKEIEQMEWDLFEKAGGKDSKQRVYKVNPYQFARTNFAYWVNADKIIDRSVGAEQQRKQTAFNILTDPRVQPYTDQQNVIEDFAIEPFSDGDPDRYKKKAGQPNEMIQSMMGALPGMPGGGMPGQGNPQPQPQGLTPMPQ